jgi:hypothetical protein
MQDDNEGFRRRCTCSIEAIRLTKFGVPLNLSAFTKWGQRGDIIGLA